MTDSDPTAREPAAPARSGSSSDAARNRPAERGRSASSVRRGAEAALRARAEHQKQSSAAGGLGSAASAPRPAFGTLKPGAGAGQIGARLAQEAIGKARQRNAAPDPEEERTVPAGDSAQPTAQEAIGDVASAALSGAVQGAVGGAAGAAAGAAKGAAFAALGNKRIRTAIISAIVVVLFVIVFAFTAPLLTVGALLSAYQPGEDGATTKSAEESGATYQEVNAARDGQDRYGLPWYLVLALTQADKSVNLQAVADKLTAEDHSREWRDLRIGGLHYSDRGYLTIPTDKSSRDYQNAQHVRDLHVPAIEAAGFSEQQANKIYGQALSWALGEDQCTADGGAGANPSPIGDDAQIGGATWNGKQVANMKTIIGMAKTMYPASARQAAVIALITARVESSFQNYANDGIITDDDGPLSASEAADYEKLKFSLTLDHDKVGTDHASVGVFQQQALFSWGDIPGSTWKTDYQGVLRRLMTPAFAAFKFLERVRDTSGWETMEPGSVAQAVQISDKPDRYAQHVPLAEAIWTAYGDSSPALPLPDGTSGPGPETTGTATATGAQAPPAMRALRKAPCRRPHSSSSRSRSSPTRTRGRSSGSPPPRKGTTRSPHTPPAARSATPAPLTSGCSR